MSRIEKLINKLKKYPKDFTYSELKKILNYLGYEEINTGKISGSRVAFFNTEIKHIIRLHKPHPEQILKEYQINLIIEELRNKNLI